MYLKSYTLKSKYCIVLCMAKNIYTYQNCWWGYRTFFLKVEERNLSINAYNTKWNWIYEQLLTRINESLKRYDYCNKTVKYSKFLID